MKINKILWLIPILAILVIGYFVVNRYWNQAPARTTAQFFSDITNSGNLKSAYSLTDAGYQKNVNLDGFGVSFSPIYKSNTIFNITKYLNNGKYAIVNGSILNLHQHDFVYDLILIKVNNNWLINNVFINPVN